MGHILATELYGNELREKGGTRKRLMIFFLQWKFSLYLPALGNKQTWTSPRSRKVATKSFFHSYVSIRVYKQNDLLRHVARGLI
jgi:hypothetical protein